MNPPAEVPDSTQLLNDGSPTILAGNNPDYPLPDTEPPPYSGPESSPPVQSHSRLPAYETIVSDDEFEDSLRLPNYSSRSRRRFHPYWPNILARLDIAPPEEETRYWNTVLDDEYVPLDVPSFLQMPVQQVEQMPLVEDMAAPPAPLQDDGDHEVNLVEQRRQRLWRLHATIIDFLLAVEQAFQEARLIGPPAVMPDPVPGPDAAPGLAAPTDEESGA